MSYIVRAANFDFAESERIKGELKKKFPFIVIHSIGKSVCGRDITAYSMGNYKEKVLFAGGFHAQEWLTSLVVLRFVETVCNAVAENKKLSGVDISKALLHKGITFVPCVNPDGVEIVQNGADTAGDFAGLVRDVSRGDLSEWNANAQGVDINHNFPAGWEILRQMEADSGILGPSPRRFGGFAPASEPESAALVRFCERNYVTHAFAIHSQGEEIYWAYGDKTPENSKTIANILSVCSGYELVPNSGLASHGGFKDWFIEYFSRPAFTIEIGKGKNPLPKEMLDEIYEKAEEMFICGAII